MSTPTPPEPKKFDYAAARAKYRPTAAGIYFARRYLSDNHYRYLVQVVGEAPFLEVAQAMDLNDMKPVRADDFCVFTWGPRVDKPTVPAAEIEISRP